jgi:hypothetical protein
MVRPVDGFDLPNLLRTGEILKRSDYLNGWSNRVGTVRAAQVVLEVQRALAQSSDKKRSHIFTQEHYGRGREASGD